MKPSSKVHLLPQALSSFQRFFPKAALQRAAREVEPRAYARLIEPHALVLAFFTAFFKQLPGLRAVAAKCSGFLKTSNHSSLCHALRRSSCLEFVRRLVALLEASCPGYKDLQLLALDSMPTTLAAKLGRNCPRYNSSASGGGVLWSFAVDARAGQNPVRVLKVVAGAWHDTAVARGVRLLAGGPVYLMDRGFYAFDLIARWIREDVRFILRARGKDLQYDVIRTVGPARDVKGIGRIETDAVVWLGSPRRKSRSQVRLVRAVLANGKVLILVSNLLDWSAPRLLEAYRKRQQIEQFHRLVKETIGLAHLYSFSWTGIEFLLRTALLLAVTLWLSGSQEGQTVQGLTDMLRRLREEMEVEKTKWRPNTIRPRRKSDKAATVLAGANP